MTKISFAQSETLPECEGIFCFYNEKAQPLYVGVAENIKREVDRIISEKNSFSSETKIVEVEFSELPNVGLIELFSATIRRKKPIYNVSLGEQKLYPHLKITREKFPRLLITRKIEADRAEYFGAFLPETAVRVLLDFLNRAFRLRSCAIPIDGKFPLPCTQFYEKRCVAPCVERVCDKETYDVFVNLVGLFLKNRKEDLTALLHEKIASAAEILDFENATWWRDILLEAQSVWNEKDRQVWLNDAVDSLEIECREQQIFIRLVTQRGRKILGKRVFVFEKCNEFALEKILSDFLWQFYQYHAPKEIRVPINFHNRKLLAEVLSRRENRQIKINVIKSAARKITTERAFGRTKFEFDFKQIKLPGGFKIVREELKKHFNLSRSPRRIECFDVAHISGTDFVAAKSVWQNGEFLVDENRYWLLDEKSELKTLEKGIEKSFEENAKSTDLILVDGGKPQLNAVLKILEQLGKQGFSVIAAVKPPRRHNQVSHFISDTGAAFKMKPDSEAMQMLVRLRDEAHELANRIHRIQRDNAHFYEIAAILPDSSEKEKTRLLQKFGSIKKIAQVSQNDLIELLGIEKGREIYSKLNNTNRAHSIKPLIVPIRFDAPGGSAKDLQPLKSTRKKKL